MIAPAVVSTVCYISFRSSAVNIVQPKVRIAVKERIVVTVYVTNELSAVSVGTVINNKMTIIDIANYTTKQRSWS